MSAGGLAVSVVALAFVVAFVLAFVLLALLSQRRWKGAAIVGGILALAVAAAAEAADYGVRYGHWNESIHARCVEEAGPKGGCP